MQAIIPISGNKNSTSITDRTIPKPMPCLGAQLLHFIFCSTSSWGRLTCEYLVDMFSCIEEERLEYIRNGKQMQAWDLFPDDEGGGTIEDEQDKQLEQLFLGTLPSSFLGSRA